MKMICGLFLKGRHIGMKVSIIDNSLCDSSFVSDVKPEAIKAYTDALHEFGVNYIEMTTDSFIMIPPASDMSKIILRMTSVRDLLYINSFDFAYVVVPAYLTDLIPKIERPVISELCLHGSDYMRVTEMFEKNFQKKSAGNGTDAGGIPQEILPSDRYMPDKQIHERCQRGYSGGDSEKRQPDYEIR